MHNKLFGKILILRLLMLSFTAFWATAQAIGAPKHININTITIDAHNSLQRVKENRAALGMIANIDHATDYIPNGMHSTNYSDISIDEITSENFVRHQLTEVSVIKTSTFFASSLNFSAFSVSKSEKSEIIISEKFGNNNILSPITRYQNPDYLIIATNIEHVNLNFQNRIQYLSSTFVPVLNTVFNGYVASECISIYTKNPLSLYPDNFVAKQFSSGKLSTIPIS